MEETLAQPLHVPAAQPDIVRAVQKDQLYIDIVTEAFQEAARGILGPRRALMAFREIPLVSSLLYYVLTTGAGSRTLGEEYCDLLQVTGRLPVEPGAARRAVLVTLQTLLPYCLQQWSQPHASAQRASEEAWPPRDACSDNAASTQDPLPHERAWNKIRLLSSTLFNLFGQYSGEAARVHLALFYIYGIYYQWPKRLAGIKYAFIGKTFEQRPSYRVLGTLLFMQLAITTGLAAADALTQQLQPQHTVASCAEVPGAKPGHAILLQEAPRPEQLHAAGHAASAGTLPVSSASSRQKCPLCLSVRTDTTSTPCGHLFCWQCIAEWCNQKPECPLCRSDFTTSQLVCLYHTNL